MTLSKFNGLVGKVQGKLEKTGSKINNPCSSILHSYQMTDNKTPPNQTTPLLSPISY